MNKELAEWAYLICTGAYIAFLLLPSMALVYSGITITLGIVTQSKRGISARTIVNFEDMLGDCVIYGYLSFLVIQMAIRVAWVIKPASIWAAAWIAVGLTVAVSVTACIILVLKKKTPAAAATAASAFIGLFWGLLMVLIAVQLNG